MTPMQPERPEGQTSGSSQRPARQVTGPTLTFDLPTELVSLKQEASWQRGDRNARTLVEGVGYRLVLMALKLGARLHEHRAAGWVSVQTLEGHARLTAGGQVIDLPVGHLTVLAPDMPHSVDALQESAILLSIAPQTKDSSRV